jgi:hypothetical protein
VLFGSVTATNLNVVNDTQLTVTSPPANVSGALDVTVYTGEAFSATSGADRFTYVTSPPPTTPMR